MGIEGKRWSPARWGSLAGFPAVRLANFSRGWEGHSRSFARPFLPQVSWENEWRREGREGKRMGCAFCLFFCRSRVPWPWGWLDFWPDVVWPVAAVLGILELLACGGGSPAQKVAKRSAPAHPCATPLRESSFRPRCCCWCCLCLCLCLSWFLWWNSLWLKGEVALGDV